MERKNKILTKFVLNSVLMRRKKRVLASFGLSSVLMLGTSLGGTYYVMENFEPEKFADKDIWLDGKQISHNDFYEGLIYKKGKWCYRSSDNTYYDLEKCTDYRVFGDKKFVEQQANKAELKTQVDTIKVKKNPKTNQTFYYYNAVDSIPNIPAMGLYLNRKITIRYFQGNTEDLQKKLDVYNDSYNCTWIHEDWHAHNEEAGIGRSGQSYEMKFAEVCMDEISANLRQLKEQRRRYKMHNNDLQYIGDRFSSYRAYLQNCSQTSEQDIMQRLKSKNLWHNETNDFNSYWQSLTNLQEDDPEYISSEERSAMANGVWDDWVRDKFDLYADRNASRTRYILSNANYNGCVNHPELNQLLMEKMFNIDGINFYPYLAGREKELIELIPLHIKEQFDKILQLKKEKMNYFQYVGQATDNDVQKKDNLFRGLKIKHKWNKFVGSLKNKGRS